MHEIIAEGRVTLKVESQSEALAVETTPVARLRKLHRVLPGAQLAIDYGIYRLENTVSVFTPLPRGGYGFSNEEK